MNLFIIGNGFDLYHRMPTRYEDFMEFMRKRHKKVFAFASEFVKAYSVSTGISEDSEGKLIWSDLEKIMGSFCIGQLDEENIKKDHRHKDRKLLRQMVKFGKHMGKYLEEWMETVSECISRKVPIYSLQRLFKEDGLYLSFNYTETLEELYDISKVLHLHGRLGEKMLMGHRVRAESGEKYLKNPLRKREDYLLRKYFAMTYKNVEHILKKNRTFFSQKNLNKIDHIYIMGHSLNSIDLIYIQQIKKAVTEQVLWTAVYLLDKDKVKIERILTDIGIPQNKIVCQKWMEL